MYDRALKIHRLFHRMAEQNRSIGNQLPGGLTLAQSQLLIEIDAAPSRSLRELERLFKFDQSSISRLSAGLEELGYLKRLPDPTDGRRYRLELTTAGRKIIDSIDQGADARLKGFCSSLTNQEIKELKGYFQKLGDGLDEPAGISRPREHLLRSEQRRLARAFGILSDSYMGTNVSVSLWHLLAAICVNRAKLSAKTLSEKLGLAKNSVSTQVAQCERKGLLQKTQNPSDARSIYISVTKKGREFFDRLEEKAATVIESGLTGFSKNEAERFIGLLERFIFVKNLLPDESQSQSCFTWARSAEERSRARGFLVLHGMRPESSIHLPEAIFGSSHLNVVMKAGDEIQAVFQFERCGKSCSLTCAGWLPTLDAHIPDLVLRAADFAGIESLEIAFPPALELCDELRFPQGLAVNL